MVGSEARSVSYDTSETPGELTLFPTERKMKYLYLALAIACLFASTVAADGCTGTPGDVGEWSGDLTLDADCPELTITVDGSTAMTNQTIVAAVHLSDEDDSVSLIVTYASDIYNQTNTDDNNARVCVPGSEKSATMAFVVSSNTTYVDNSTTFNFFYEFASTCEDVSSPSSGFCCWGWVILGLVVAVLVVVIIAAVAGFMIWKKRQSQDKYIYDDA